MKVLVTGGAGYIGSVLARLLLSKGYEVRVVDNLSYGGESLLGILNNENFEFVKGELTESRSLPDFLAGIDAVVHLAAIVGDPACAKNPDLAKRVNLEASINLFENAHKMGVKRFIYASTCSNYGKMKDPNALVDETSELRPVSLYAELKVGVEKHILASAKKKGFAPTCLRFSTAYGLSARPRFDLTVNEFAKDLALGRKLLVFGEQFWRPYCHTVDLSRAMLKVLEADEKLADQEVYNVGDTQENYTKKMIVDLIKKFLPKAEVDYVSKNEDPRDYKVSFKKIKDQLGFKISRTVEDGVKEILNVVGHQSFLEPDQPRYKNI